MSSGISQQLAQVVVIGWFKLVLNYHRAVTVQFGSQYIQRIATYRCFRILQLQIHAQRFAQLDNVFCKPRGEVTSLIGPGFAQIDSLYFRKVRRSHF